MTESQTDYDIQKICHLEARMRNFEPRASITSSHPSKKIEPLQLIMLESKVSKAEGDEHNGGKIEENGIEKKENIDSIDLKTNQKLKEISLEGEFEEKAQIPTEKHNKIQGVLPGKMGTESRKYVKRRLDLEYDVKKGKNLNNEIKKLNFDEKNPMINNNNSDNSNEGINFHHNNVANNTKITDYFEIKLNRKPDITEKKIDFKSIRSSKQLQKSAMNPIISLILKKNAMNAENKADVNNCEFPKKENSSSESNQVPEYLSENLRLKEEIRKLNKKILDKDNQINEGQSHFNELIQENKSLQDGVKYYEEYLQKYSVKTKDVLCRILLESEKIKRQEIKNHLFSQRQRLGEYVSQRQGHKFVDVWLDGFDLRNLKEKLAKIKFEREELEKKKKNFKTKKAAVANSSLILQANKSLFSTTISHLSDSENNYDSNSNSDITPSEFKNRISFQLAMLQREENNLNEDLKRLEQEKMTYIQQFKRQFEEENCRFAKPDIETGLSAWPLLNKKYQALSLLGKGGFSEVYKVFDMNNYRENACKIHQLNSLWTENAKQQYIKHALRETQTHKTLNHPNIVKLYETFELDQTTLCTILEYCNGPDLSLYLKQNKMLQEKDAKMIMKQILYGLKYLHENQRKIIHYDLKPQNILFHMGEIKITDFGLCKVMDANTNGLELTSQGVGTYWYLPPECFEMGENPPKITTKVDIWSVGVIFYEMIFGEKPFGNNMSQEKILKEQVILSVDGVKFPPKPNVSNECKEFISNCLIKLPDKRWDIKACLNSSFMNKK